MSIPFIVIVFLLPLVVIILYVLYLRVRWRNATINDLLKFIYKNPEKSSMYMIENNDVIIDYQADQVMPLDSTMKIIIAIEYAKQVSEQKIDKNQLVSLTELDLYYLEKTDGGAHPKWIESIKDKGIVKKDLVCLEEVARGMIEFSSNANTEYLIRLLGLDQINTTLSLLGLKSHTRVFPTVSTLLISTYVRDVENLTDKKAWKHRILSMSQEQYEKYALEIHHHLSSDHDRQFRNKYFRNECLKECFQKKRSERFIAASAKDYARLMNRLNRRDLLSQEAHSILQTVLETKSLSGCQYVGFKGGSTLFILTFSIYLTTEGGEQIELAIFIHDDLKNPYLWMRNVYAEFVKKMLLEKDYRQRVAKNLE